MSFVPWATAAWLFAVGIYGVITSRHYVHLIGCLTVIQSSTYVALLSVGYRFGSVAPILAGALAAAWRRDAGHRAGR